MDASIIDKNINKEELAEFADYLAQAKDLIAQMKVALAAAKETAARDHDAYWDDHLDELEGFQNGYDNLMVSIQNIAHSLYPRK